MGMVSHSIKMSVRKLRLQNSHEVSGLRPSSLNQQLRPGRWGLFVKFHPVLSTLKVAVILGVFFWTLKNYAVLLKTL